MANDERLVVMLEARVSDFEKKMKRASRTGTDSYRRLRSGSSGATRQMEQDMTRSTTTINQALATTSTRIGAFSKSFVAGFAGGAITAALATLTSGLGQTVRSIAEVSDEAKRSGLALEAFQEWKFVAEQNRIGIDAVVDGFKELNLRADEFVETGGGSAAEAFTRLGFTAAELEEQLKDPSELMLEIIGRMEELDKAAQIRISDEVFGGTGGERFVELLSQGEAGLRSTMGVAHEAGAVMDSELIRKAEELDRKWQELTARVTTFGKTLAVTLADLPFDIVETRINEIFSAAEGKSILGEDVYDDLRQAGALTDEQVDKLTLLRQEYRQLADDASLAAGQMLMASDNARMQGFDALSDTLGEAGTELRKLAEDFRAGTIDGETFRAKLAEIQTEAAEAFGALDQGEQVNFTEAISQITRLGTVIQQAAERAWNLFNGIKASSSAAPGMTTGSFLSGDSADDLLAPGDGMAMQSSQRPRAAPSGIGGVDWGVDTGSQGGGGSGNSTAYTDALAETERQIALLQAETAALLEAAAAGQTYGDQIAYAAKRAELMEAAQQQGLAVTPELTAEIDQQAAAYARMGVEAQKAAQKVEEVDAASQRGEAAVGNVFGAMVQGSDEAKQALASLFAQIAQAQFTQGMTGLLSAAGGDGFMSWLGGLLSFDGGGYTGNGPRTGGVDGKGGMLSVVHPNETVIDHSKGQGQGQSGNIEMSASSLTLSDNGTIMAEVNARVVSGVQQGISGYDKALPGRVKNINNNPRRR